MFFKNLLGGKILKKFVSMLLCFVLCFSMMPVTHAVTTNSYIGVIINGRVISFDVEPQIINGRTFVPMRKIFEEMGAGVDYDEETQTIYVWKDDKDITMQVGSKTISVNGVTSTMNAAPTVIDSRTLVPVRAISECLNASVEWNDKLHKVIIFDWDNITINKIGYNKCSVIPDFGEYVGLDYTEVDESVNLEDYYYINNYVYKNDLGTNKAAILADYRKVLKKNGFTLFNATDLAPNYEEYMIESDGKCFIVIVPIDLDVAGVDGGSSDENCIDIAQEK